MISRRPGPGRWRPAFLALGLTAAALANAAGAPGHAAGIPVSSETLTTHVVGNPP